MLDPPNISLSASGDNAKLIGYINRIGVFNQIIHFRDFQQLKDSVQLNPTSPYKDLKRFESVDKQLFFGRDRFLQELFQELDQTNLILLLGASGSGKSSVVRAGMIARLADSMGSQFIDLTFTPNQDPFASLSYCLHTRYPKIDCQLLLEGNSDTLVRAVKDLKPADDFWFIFIDQFEELFTLSQPEKCKSFMKSLEQLVKVLDKPSNCKVKIVATMRSDFLDKLSPYPAFIKLTDRHRPIIAEMQSDELRLAIEQPALHHGVAFEQGLVAEIIQDVQGQAGYLPLLQYTLNLLWKIEVDTGSINDRTLNITNYRELGGVRGALQKHVDIFYQGLSKPEQLVVQQIFLKIIEIGGDQTAETQWKPIRRRANRSEFENPLEQKMVARLIDENLLVSSHETQSKESTIEITHEILLTSWTTLRDWIRDNRSSIALRNRLNNDVRLWQAKKTKEELWSGSKLAQVLDLRKDQTFNQVLGGFNREANDFIDASVNRRNHQRYRTIAIWTGFSTLALLSVTLFITLGTTSLARTFNRWGYDEYLNNNTKKAMQNYKLAFDIRTDYAPPLLNMGLIYEDEQDFESAAKNYNDAISVSMNKFTSAYIALARLYILEKKDQPLYTYEAIKLLETAWRLPIDKNLDQEYLEDYQNHKYFILKNLGWAKLNLKLYSEAEVAEARGAKQAALESWKLCQKKGVEDNPDEKHWKKIAEVKIKTQNK
jgi:tetratricopeptide (TPR) repeat protein/energy-coupling factor transporter ATP-binding protein EcfA2